MALTGSTTEEKIWNFLIGKGMSKHGAAGLMGNLYAESALNPKNLQNSYETKLGYTDDTYTAAVDSGAYGNFVRDSAGYGLAQWTYWSRKENIKEIADAISNAVSATSQTYVDALKQAGTFTKEAQAEAAKKALEACIASISPAAREFIEQLYGDISEYLSAKIEAEVRKQKLEAPATVALPVLESTADTTAIAASTAAATAATIAQTAISQLSAEAPADQA